MTEEEINAEKEEVEKLRRNDYLERVGTARMLKCPERLPGKAHYMFEDSRGCFECGFCGKTVVEILGHPVSISINDGIY